MNVRTKNVVNLRKAKTSPSTEVTNLTTRHSRRVKTSPTKIGRE